MIRQIIFLISILSAYAYLSLGQGALGAVILQTGPEYGFSDTFLGSLVAVMYIGFVVGNIVLRYLLPRVTYIRTYAVSAAAMAICVLLLPLLPYEIAWIVLRFTYGLFFFTAIVLFDSWLNGIATPENRSRLLGVVWTFNFIAHGLSQYILLLSDSNKLIAFSITSIAFVLSLIFMCMTRVPEPVIGDNSTSIDITIKSSYKVAPIAMMGQFFFGMVTGATWLFIRYAEDLTDNISQTSTLAVLFFGSGFLLQYLVGAISDKVRDRRIVMSGVYLISSISAIGLFFGEHLSYNILLFFAVVFGSSFVTIYALNVAYGQDFIESDKRASYSARIFQAYAAGAIFGPLIAGALMENLGTIWLFGFIAIIMTGMLVISITDRILPRYMPVRPQAFNFASNYSPAIVTDREIYNELDIGPTIEPSPEPAKASQAAEGLVSVGPIDSTTIGQTNQSEAEGTIDYVGPIFPDMSEEDIKEEPLQAFDTVGPIDSTTIGQTNQSEAEDTINYIGPIFPDMSEEDIKEKPIQVGPIIPDNHTIRR